MAASTNRTSMNLRGHEYVTGRASPIIGTGEESSRFLSAKGLAGDAMSALSAGVEDVLGSMIQCVKRHPIATLCLGVCVAVALTATFGGLSERIESAER